MALMALIQFRFTWGQRSFSSIFCRCWVIGHPMHPMRWNPWSYSSQCGTRTTSFRNSHTSRSVQWRIGEISRLSFPLMHPRVCSSVALVIFTSPVRSSVFPPSFFSRYASKPSSVPLYFRLEIYTSLRFFRRWLSCLRMPMSVTFPAPAISLYSAQHHRTRIVGNICFSTAN